jgi:hypothetical protein
MKKMTKNQRSAAEMYALRAITLLQFAELFRNEPTYRFIAALKYAIAYGKRFDDWLANRKLRADEIEECWESLTEDDDRTRLEFAESEYYDNIDPDFDADYDAALEQAERQNQLNRIAIEAKWQGVSLSTVQKFFKTYNLTSSEISRFWMLYYGSFFK